MNFTKHVLIDFAKLCNISYLSSDKVVEGFYSRPINNTSEESVFYKCDAPPTLYSCDRDSQMYVCKYDNKLSITFRGTESGRDILTDLNLILVELPLKNLEEKEDVAEVHWGFYNQFSELKPNIDKIVKEYYDTADTVNKEIIFSGHSLGGALATISALNYANKYPDITVDCITLGSPRVGNNKFAEMFNKSVSSSYRFVNDNDPIPCLPTAWRYKHVKGCVWLTNDEVRTKINVWRGWHFFKNYILSFFGFGYDASQDHNCQGYIKDMQILPEN